MLNQMLKFFFLLLSVYLFGVHKLTNQITLDQNSYLTDQLRNILKAFHLHLSQMVVEELLKYVIIMYLKVRI